MSGTGDDIGFAYANDGDGPRAIIPSIRQPKRPVPRRSPLWIGATIAIAVVLIGGITAVVVVRQDNLPVAMPISGPVAASPDAAIPWDRAHRVELGAMKDAAQRLAASGDLQQSLAQYNKLLVTVGDHEITDPVTAQLIASARAEQSVVFASVMQHRSTTATPATAPPDVTPNVAAIDTPSGSKNPPILVPSSVAAPNPSTPAVTIAPATAPTQIAAAGTTQPTSVDPVDSAIAAVDNAPPLSTAPSPVALHGYTLLDGVTDEEIGRAIEKGVAYLRSRFAANGEVIATAGDTLHVMINGPQLGNGPFGGNGPLAGLGPFGRGRRGQPPQGPSDDDMPNPAMIEGAYTTPGFDALCVYALLQSGQALDPKILEARDPFAVLILNRLKKYDLSYTYHRSLRAAALAVLNRQQDTSALEEDVRWLISASREGAYTYIAPKTSGRLFFWDNSNSQYGLLGVWSGAQAGLAVPNTYWSAVDSHWTQCASGNGTWGYFTDSSPTLSMTLAGVASELVSRDYLNAPNGPADAGLSWLDAGDNCTAGVTESEFPSYTLYGLERVGLASGFKYFGKHDWYSEFAQKLVAQQNLDGSWGPGGNQSLVDTSYFLLFLARGRHPILFNKLRYDGNWDGHPRDVSHLAHYAARQLERPLNWQVVNLRRDWFDWLDAPVLYISGNTAPTFSDADYSALRSFAEGGGLIFTQAVDGSTLFNHWVATAARKMFPRYELMTVSANHPIYSVNYQIKHPPTLQAISNGSRLLLVHSPTDIAKGWQLDWSDTYANDFRLGLNLFVYAAGKSVSLKHRLASSYIPAPPEAPSTTDTMTSLRYTGAWNPEPYALSRFARYFQWETHVGLNVPVVDLKSLQPLSTPMAVLTGTVRYDFTDSEVTAARNYVDAGGVLVIDACGGQAPFARSVETTLIARAFPSSKLLPLADNHPALIASRPGASDLQKPLYRLYAVEQVGRLPLLGFSFGRGRVVYSRLDLTTGLLGTQSWGILGFDPAYAQALMKNLVLWSTARSTAQSQLPMREAIHQAEQ